VIKNKACPVKLQIKIAHETKEAMASALRGVRAKLHDAVHIHNKGQEEDFTDEEAARLPELKYGPDDQIGWTTFEKPILFVYAGQGPQVGR
jgi:sphingosine kinase